MHRVSRLQDAVLYPFTNKTQRRGQSPSCTVCTRTCTIVRVVYRSKMSTIGSISFLSQDGSLYMEEKPYSLKFPPPDGLPKSNIQGYSHDEVIENVRGQEERFSIESHGFALVPLESVIKYDEYDDEEKIVELYLPQVAAMLKRMLKASRVQIFEHLVRPLS